MNEKVTKIKHLGYKNGSKILLCKCNKCGALIEMYASHYYRGSTSCKCELSRVKYPRLYGIWSNMKTRCHNKNTTNYERYGAKHISICSEWEKFEPFKDWALSQGYRDDLTIDRIDYNGNYEPSNCRWITRDEQARNKSNNVNFIYKGEKHCMRELSRLIGVNYKTMYTYYSRHGYEATVKKYNLKEGI